MQFHVSLLSHVHSMFIWWIQSDVAKMQLPLQNMLWNTHNIYYSFQKLKTNDKNWILQISNKAQSHNKSNKHHRKHLTHRPLDVCFSFCFCLTHIQLLLLEKKIEETLSRWSKWTTFLQIFSNFACCFWDNSYRNSRLLNSGGRWVNRGKSFKMKL